MAPPVWLMQGLAYLIHGRVIDAYESFIRHLDKDLVTMQ